MKKTITILLLLVSAVLFSQETARQFIDKGIALHDAGKYTEALEQYNKALSVQKDSDDAIYEMGATYSAMKDYAKAIECADKVIKLETHLLGKAYLLKGISLDYSGKPKEAIEVYKKGMKKAPDFNRLDYALAVTSYNLKEFKDTEEALYSSLKKNPLHANSHYLLGFINADKRTKSMLALFNFLILEPTGSKANVAFNTISKFQKTGVEVKDDKSINVTISLDNKDDEFSPAEMTLSMLEASNNMDENKSKSDFQLFSENTKSFFNVLGELQANNKNKGFWWSFYVSFFYDLAKNDEMYETFTYYVYQDVQNTAVESWLIANKGRVEKFKDWVSNHKRK